MSVMQATAQQFPDDFTPEKQQRLYEEIVRLYDLADNVLAAAQKADISNREQQVGILTPFITQVVNSTNMISAFYANISKNNMLVTPETRDVLESAIRNVFYALRELVDAVEGQLVEKQA